MNSERLKGPSIRLASSEIKDLAWFLVFIRRFNKQDCDASWPQWHHDPLIRHYTIDPFLRSHLNFYQANVAPVQWISTHSKDSALLLFNRGRGDHYLVICLLCAKPQTHPKMIN